MPEYVLPSSGRRQSEPVDGDHEEGRISVDTSSVRTRSGADDDFTTRLIGKLASVRWAKLDEATRHAARRHLIDAVGLIYAGGRERTASIADATLSALREEGELPVLGRTRKSDVLDATYLMTIASHCLEFDDGYRSGAAHPGSVVIPAALAVCTQQRLSGLALLEAVVVGYEAMTSIARAAHPALRGRGFHATAAAGVFGAAAAAGHLLRLNPDQMRSAYGLAASSAGGLFAFVQGGEDVKALQVAHAAREGVFSALLAQKGADAPPRAIEGHKGFFAVLAGLPEVSTTAVGEQWGINECYIKPWPGCRHLHPAIDAVLHLQAENEFSSDDVATVAVTTYSVAADRQTMPWGTVSSALLSFRFVLSVAILFGDVKIGYFADNVRADPRIDEMSRRITINSTVEMDEGYVTGNPAEVTITLKDGRHLKHDVISALGSPDHLLTNAALSGKFVDLVTAVTDRPSACRLEAAWSRIAEVEDVAGLVAAS